MLPKNILHTESSETSSFWCFFWKDITTPWLKQCVPGK